MVFRIVNSLMALLFAVAVAVQYNDPDPVRWMALYGAACLVSLTAAVRERAPMLVAAGVGIVALAWGAYWAVTSGTALTLYEHMFDSWEMKDTHIEEAREASGLFIVAIWMAVVAARSRSEVLWRSSARR